MIFHGLDKCRPYEFGPFLKPVFTVSSQINSLCGLIAQF